MRIFPRSRSVAKLGRASEPSEHTFWENSPRQLGQRLGYCSTPQGRRQTSGKSKEPIWSAELLDNYRSVNGGVIDQLCSIPIPYLDGVGMFWYP
jgi:hypothetical protein